MKLAVLADIHANLEALQTVQVDLEKRNPDLVVIAGDTINRGPQPKECLQSVLQARKDLGWDILKGNHEDFVLAEQKKTANRAQWQKEVHQHSIWTGEQVSDHLDEIAALPDQVEVNGPCGQTIRVVHASMQSNREGLHEEMEDNTIRALIHPAPDLLGVGHTHRPFIRRIENHLVVNAGAVGLPFDGDPRISYAWITWTGSGWSAEIVRLDYQRERTLAAIHHTGYFSEGGPMVPLVIHELESARSNFRRWHRDYEGEVAQGQMTVKEAVRALLGQRQREATTLGP